MFNYATDFLCTTVTTEQKENAKVKSLKLSQPNCLVG